VIPPPAYELHKASGVLLDNFICLWYAQDASLECSLGNAIWNPLKGNFGIGMETALLLVQSVDGQTLEVIEALPSNSELAHQIELFASEFLVTTCELIVIAAELELFEWCIENVELDEWA
jgi:hypothetical protein